MTGVLIRTEGHRETHREGGNVDMEAEIGVIANNHQKLEKQHKTDSPSEPLEGIDPADTLISDFKPPELGEDKFLLF